MTAPSIIQSRLLQRHRRRERAVFAVVLASAAVLVLVSLLQQRLVDEAEPEVRLRVQSVSTLEQVSPTVQTQSKLQAEQRAAPAELEVLPSPRLESLPIPSPGLSSVTPALPPEQPLVQPSGSALSLLQYELPVAAAASGTGALTEIASGSDEAAAPGGQRTPAQRLGSIATSRFYPLAAQRRGTAGWTRLQLRVSASGSVAQVTVLQSQPAGVFDAAARRLAQQLQYRAATENGTAVDSTVQLRIEWQP